MSQSAVDREFERRLSALINSGQPQILQGGRKGVEKESLRVTPRREHRALRRIRVLSARRSPTSTSRPTTPRR